MARRKKKGTPDTQYWGENEERAVIEYLATDSKEEKNKIYNQTLRPAVDTLIESGIVRNPKDGVKILGNGELTKKLTVQVNAFSKSAVEKIEALGGKAEVI